MIGSIKEIFHVFYYYESFSTGLLGPTSARLARDSDNFMVLDRIGFRSQEVLPAESA